MAGTRDGTAMAQPIWDPEPVSLKDFVMKHEIPTVAKIVKGQFMSIGVSKNPLKKLHQDVLVHSIKTGVKILAHSVMKVEGRDRRSSSRLVAMEQRLSIPLTYKGWFELLSEDGRAVRPIETVRQLHKMYPVVNKVLVRHNIKAYVVNDDGKLTFNSAKIVISGEQLTITGDITIPSPASVDGKIHLLKCTDYNGKTLFLSFDQKGMFTPIAGPTDVMGVFMIGDIIKRFRLPLTVKLTQGVWPKVDASRFTGLIRLDWAYTDEAAFVCPLDRAAPRIYPIPTEVPLSLAAATNNNVLRENEAYTNITVKCNRMVSNYHNTIHLIVSVPEGAVKAKNNMFTNVNLDSPNKSVQSPERTPSQIKRSKSREDILLDELDDLYGYLREGKHPPIGKYARDSDEETYYEEPEFEPIDKFKSRLAMLNKGDAIGSQKNSKYNFVDPRSKLDGSRTPAHKTNGHVTRISDTPPALPPRVYKRVDSAPVINFHPNGKTHSGDSGGSGSGKEKTTPERTTPERTTPVSKLVRQKSEDSTSKGSKSSSGERGKDYQDGRSSRSGSAKALRSRRSVPFLYL